MKDYKIIYAGTDSNTANAMNKFVKEFDMLVKAGYIPKGTPVINLTNCGFFITIIMEK